MEALPGYAPDLNPWDEGGWHHLKNVEMRNLSCRDLEELHEQFHLVLNRLRQKPHLVRSFFAQTGLLVAKSYVTFAAVSSHIVLFEFGPVSYPHDTPLRLRNR